MKYGTFWQRFFALWIDFFVLLPLIALQMWLSSLSKTCALVQIIPMTFVFIGYHIYLHGRFGQTAGKWVMGIRVVKLNGERIGWREAWLRSSVDIGFASLGDISRTIALVRLSDADFDVGWRQRAQAIIALEPHTLRWVGFAAGCWGWSEVFVMLLNRRRRALHDFIAGTVVVALPQAAQLLESP
jgi:uncharacterized RDD family membrane protein YckC